MNTKQWAEADKQVRLMWVRGECDEFIHPSPPVMEWDYAQALEFVLERERRERRQMERNAREWAFSALTR